MYIHIINVLIEFIGTWSGKGAGCLMLLHHGSLLQRPHEGILYVSWGSGSAKDEVLTSSEHDSR